MSRWLTVICLLSLKCGPVVNDSRQSCVLKCGPVINDSRQLCVLLMHTPVWVPLCAEHKLPWPTRDLWIIITRVKVIWQKTTLLCYHIHQVAALVTKLVVAGASGTQILGESEVVGGQWWYHSKQRCWFPIGSPLWPLCYLWPFAAVCQSNSQKLPYGTAIYTAELLAIRAALQYISKFSIKTSIIFTDSFCSTISWISKITSIFNFKYTYYYTSPTS